MPQLNFPVILPVAALSAWACALLVVDLFVKRRGLIALLAALGLALTLGFTLAQAGSQATGFNGMVVADGFSTFVGAVLLGSALFAVALAHDYLARMEIDRAEYYPLMLFSVAGMLLMAQSTDLIMIFVSLELLSIPLYVMAAFARPQVASEEAGIKYFLLGSFAAGFMVYGIALTFGATGSTSLAGIVRAAAVSPLLLGFGATLILVGLAFKVAAVPFHMWTPDVYEGAPTAVTAFMAAGAKIAGFAALLRVFSTAFPTLAVNLSPMLGALAALTMIVGNLIAISQTNIKRMLAYSSIAHAGYILMAFVPYGVPEVAKSAQASGLFYLAAYALTNFGAWAVVIALEDKQGKGLEISDYAGLGHRYPALAAAMTVFLLSLTGMPPTLGFVGKLYLFRAALQGGQLTLAVIGVLASLISAYYYLRVVVAMYMREGQPVAVSERWLNFTWASAAILTVAVSLVPAPLFTWAQQAVMGMF